MREYEGGRRQFEGIAHQLGENVLLVDNQSSMHELAIAMKFIFDVDCYVLYGAPDREGFQACVDGWVKQKKRVYVTSGLADRIGSVLQEYLLTGSETVRVTYPHVTIKHTEMPAEIMRVSIVSDVFEITGKHDREFDPGERKKDGYPQF